MTGESPWHWPALDLGHLPPPERLAAERAIWGKVHGAASDFRWIARSPGIDPQTRRLERELFLGSEDAPARATSWRALDEACCAVACYPSRAVDAALRSGFLEKQVLVWRPEGAPAAVGALALLPQVAVGDDSAWWGASGDPGWDRPGFCLDLDAPAPVVAARDLAAAIERGRAAIRETVEEGALAGLYSSLLAGRRPAFLSGLERPLPPEALAALLLPLPREIADRLSIAGWVVSLRLDPETLPRLWNVLVCNRIPAVFRAAPASERSERGRVAARALLEGDPQRLGAPSCTTPVGVLRAAPTAAPAADVRDRILAFATDECRRWLEPDELVGPTRTPLRLADAEAGELMGCVAAVEDESSRLSCPPGAPDWKRRHLQVKADVLRAVALVLAPHTVPQLGLPGSGRVPALLFCPQLDARDWDRLAELLGEERLDDAVRQSLSCRPDLFGGAIRRWLADWRRRTRNPACAQVLARQAPGASC